MRGSSIALFGNVAARTAASAGGGGLTTIIEEVGGTDSSDLYNTAPNSVNTPGNLWGSQDTSSCIRANSRIEADGNNRLNHIETDETDVVVSVEFENDGGGCKINARHGSGVFGNEWEGFSAVYFPFSPFCRLYRDDSNGTAGGTLLDSSTTELTGPVTITLTVNGDQISAEFTDGTTTVNLGPETDTAHSTKTKAGFLLTDTGTHIEFFKVEI